jgi:hypothetical protein
MTTDFQTIAALVVVAITATWMIARSMSKGRKPSCGGCPSQGVGTKRKNWKIVETQGE